MSSTPLRLSFALLLSAALAGCGKSLPVEGSGRGASVTTVAGTNQLAASGLATKNTTRLGGGSPVADAAAVALATYPGLTAATRPQAVVLVDDRDWPAALAAAALASAPLRAPLLYSEGNSLPALTAQALAALKPTGAVALKGAQVVEVGTSAAPAGYRRIRVQTSGAQTGSAQTSDTQTRSAQTSDTQTSDTQTSGAQTSGTQTSDTQTSGAQTSGTQTSGTQTSGELARDEQAALAAKVARLVETLHGGPPNRVIVVGADGPPALAMPAAGLAAESGAPILMVDAAGVPPATSRVLARLRHPTIYAMGPPAAVSHAVLAQLAHFGAVRRIYPTPGANGSSGPGTSGEDPADNAIAVARYSDGSFGWGVEQPGHGLAFANASRPLDAPAAAPLSASGEYAPLLLLEGPDQVPDVLREYLSDIRPAYGAAPEYQPVRGVYNHGWLIGDGEAIAPTVQAELDTMLEISPQSSANSASTAPSAAEPSTPSLSAAEPSTTAAPATAPSTPSP
jgi:hypothetical protein